MKRSKKLMLFAIVCLIPIMVAMIPAAHAAISTPIATDDHEFEIGTTFNQVSLSWQVTSGSAIDVFILTAIQYATWAIAPNTDPTTYVMRQLSTTSGSVDQRITKSLVYYAVFSNENGGTPTDGTFTVTWSNMIPGFGLFSVLFGILFIGICFYMGRKINLRRA